MDTTPRRYVLQNLRLHVADLSYFLCLFQIPLDTIWSDIDYMDNVYHLRNHDIPHYVPSYLALFLYVYLSHLFCANG